LAHSIAHTPQNEFKKALKAKGYSDPEAFVNLYSKLEQVLLMLLRAWTEKAKPNVYKESGIKKYL